MFEKNAKIVYFQANPDLVYFEDNSDLVYFQGKMIGLALFLRKMKR